MENIDGGVSCLKWMKNMEMGIGNTIGGVAFTILFPPIKISHYSIVFLSNLESIILNLIFSKLL